jgi:hypothetical protein
MADTAGTKPLSSDAYHGVLAGNQTETTVDSDLGLPIDVDDFYSPQGTLDDVENGAAASITTNQSNDADWKKVLFRVPSIVRNEATTKVSEPTEVNKSPKTVRCERRVGHFWRFVPCCLAFLRVS